MTTNRDSQVITSSQLSDFPQVSEASAHDDGLVAVFLVVVEDLLHALDAWVLLWAIILFVGCFVPVEDAANEGRDEEAAGFSGGNGLRKGEHESQVAVDAMLGLQHLGGFDTFPCRGELDENAGLVDTNGFVELGKG